MTLTVNARSSTEEITRKLFEILPVGCLEQGCSGDTGTCYINKFNAEL